MNIAGQQMILALGVSEQRMSSSCNALPYPKANSPNADCLQHWNQSLRQCWEFETGQPLITVLFQSDCLLASQCSPMVSQLRFGGRTS